MAIFQIKNSDIFNISAQNIDLKFLKLILKLTQDINELNI